MPIESIVLGSIVHKRRLDNHIGDCPEIQLHILIDGDVLKRRLTRIRQVLIIVGRAIYLAEVVKLDHLISPVA